MNIGITLIAQVLAFVILIWLINKHLWTPVSEVLEARRKKIADGLSASEKGLADRQKAKKEVAQALNKAKTEASDIIAQAQLRSSQIIDEAKHKALEEAAHVKAAADAELAQEINRAKDSLRVRVSELAVAGASKILNKEIDASTHKMMLDELVAKV